jgi:hypothetical protein
MCRRSDVLRLLLAGCALAAVTTVPALPVPSGDASELHEALAEIAHSWSDEAVALHTASACERPALQWYWVCDGAE